MAKYTIADSLRGRIEADLDKCMKWNDIAEENAVEIGVVCSVFGTKRVRESQNGEIVRYWNGMRVTDGKPSPINTYHISELEK
ncbi:hypothetical protein [Priestia endophytica]|uniref:hypothetical protein n=1 Tax=Priestia endophytica TaxID=135735 RepID=UPI002281F966|nr:hypothetical protein [Priestia endophytica]MCY8233692.1 hypothetical protein [Priestia endophytica]